MAVKGTLQQVQQWASGYLGYLGAPKSQGNIEGLSAQVYQEGNFGTAYGGGSTNPLNIEGSGPGGFLRPATTQAGYAATASFMERNDPGMVAALRANKGTSPQPYINALSSGQWEALHSSGKDYLNKQYGADVASTLGRIYQGKYQAPPPSGSSGGTGAKKPTPFPVPSVLVPLEKVTVGGLSGWTLLLVVVGLLLVLGAFAHSRGAGGGGGGGGEPVIFNEPHDTAPVEDAAA